MDVGTIMMWAAETLPANFKECNGEALDKTAYAALYAVIGDVWGTVGSNFNIPDMRGRFLRGWSDTSSNDPDKTTRTAHATGGQTGNKVGTIQAEAIYGHAHSWSGYSGGTTDDTGSISFFVWNAGHYAGYSASTGSETRPDNVYVRYCIKYM